MAHTTARPCLPHFRLPAAVWTTAPSQGGLREWNQTLALLSACRRAWHTSLMACTRSVAPSFFVIASLLPYIYEKLGLLVSQWLPEPSVATQSLSLLPSRAHTTYIISRLTLNLHLYYLCYLHHTITLRSPHSFINDLPLRSLSVNSLRTPRHQQYSVLLGHLTIGTLWLPYRPVDTIRLSRIFELLLQGLFLFPFLEQG